MGTQNHNVKTNTHNHCVDKLLCGHTKQVYVKSESKSNNNFRVTKLITYPLFLVPKFIIPPSHTHIKQHTVVFCRDTNPTRQPPPTAPHTHRPITLQGGDGSPLELSTFFGPFTVLINVGTDRKLCLFFVPFSVLVTVGPDGTFIRGPPPPI